MPRSSYGSGTVFQRGEIWYVAAADKITCGELLDDLREHAART